MNPNNEIKYTFKADVGNFEQGINQVKQGLDELKTTSSNFTVNWGEGSGSVEEFQAWREEAERAAQAMNETAQAIDIYSTSADEGAESTNALAETTSETTSVIETLKEKITSLGASIKSGIADGATYAKESLEGFTARMDESTQSSALLTNTTRTAKAGFVALAAGITAYAKSALDEYAKASEDYAGTQASLNSSMSQLKLTFAQVIAPVMEYVAGLAQVLAENRELVAVLASAAAGVVALVAVVKAASLAISVAKAMTSGWIGVLGLLAGVAAAAYASTLDLGSGINYDYKKTAELTEQIADLDAQIAKAEATAGGAGGTVGNTINDVSKQLAKLEKNFRQSLKQIAVNHEQTIENLTQQIREANFEYQRAIDERNAAFAVSQAEEAEKHQDKIDELTAQIDFLQRYNNKYNEEKLKKLQYALAKEENRYKEQTKLEQAELELQNANDKAAYDEKIANLQAELDKELEFQNKHREALQSVRDEILLDEIESLQAQYEEQKASYAEQIALAGASGASAGNAFSDETLNALKAKKAELQAQLDQLTNADASASANGARAGQNWFESISESISNFLRTQGVFKDFWNMLDEQVYKYGSIWGEMQAGRWDNAFKLLGFADGGYTGQGGKDEVAGIVHKGEYVLPQEMVDQTTGTPKSLGAQYITINVNGTFATSAVERRKVAEQIADALQQTANARLGA